MSEGRVQTFWTAVGALAAVAAVIIAIVFRDSSKTLPLPGTTAPANVTQPGTQDGHSRPVAGANGVFTIPQQHLSGQVTTTMNATGHDSWRNIEGSWIQALGRPPQGVQSDAICHHWRLSFEFNNNRIEVTFAPITGHGWGHTAYFSYSLASDNRITVFNGTASTEGDETFVNAANGNHLEIVGDHLVNYLNDGSVGCQFIRAPS